MKITEVYFRSKDKKPGQQWFEIFNDDDQPVNVRKAPVKRLDTLKKKQAWSANLPDQDLILGPGQYAIIAQKKDLGQNLCSEHWVIVLEELKLASQGVQELCILESCTKINDSKSTEKDASRNLILDSWFNESCEIKPGFHASPGLPMAFCQKNSDSGWSICPEEPVPETPTATAAPQTEATTQASTVRRHTMMDHSHASGCQMVSWGFDGSLFLGVLLWIWLFR